MTDEERFNDESLQDTETIAAYLESLIQGFREGKIPLKSEEGEFIIYPQGMMTLGIKAKRKHYKTKFTLKVSWKDPGDGHDTTASET